MIKKWLIYRSELSRMLVWWVTCNQRAHTSPYQYNSVIGFVYKIPTRTHLLCHLTQLWRKKREWFEEPGRLLRDQSLKNIHKKLSIFCTQYLRLRYKQSLETEIAVSDESFRINSRISRAMPECGMHFSQYFQGKSIFLLTIFHWASISFQIWGKISPPPPNSWTHFSNSWEKSFENKVLSFGRKTVNIKPNLGGIQVHIQCKIWLLKIQLPLSRGKTILAR